MEQQHTRDGKADERRQRARDSIPPGCPATMPLGSGGAAQDSELALEEFELDDIEEIESKVFA